MWCGLHSPVRSWKVLLQRIIHVTNQYRTIPDPALWVPHTSGLRVGFCAIMTKNLKQYYGRGDLHFLTFRCYWRLPLLGCVHARNSFVEALWKIRERYKFLLVGYVVIPEDPPFADDAMGRPPSLLCECAPAYVLGRCVTRVSGPDPLKKWRARPDSNGRPSA